MEDKEAVIQEMLLITREGAKEIKILCNIMGYPFTLDNKYTSLVTVPFITWVQVPGMPLVHITLADGVSVLVNKDVIRGQCTVTVKEPEV